MNRSAGVPTGTGSSSGQSAVEVSGVSVRYVLTKERPRTLQEYLIRLASGQMARNRDFWALRDITFRVKRGESLGIIGSNGSGKSTILKVIAGVLKPTEGEAHVNGRIAPLIELGAGFDMELTGIENIYLNASILGLSRKETDRKLKRIIDFSEISNFVYSPMRSYSSGMVARLAFSVAVEVEADILIVDEVLSVGDEGFKKKCHHRIDDFIKRGITLLFVSHNVAEIQRLCSTVVWIEKGRLVETGDPEIASRRYILKFEKTVFDDIGDEHPYKKYIDAMFIRGITSGYTVNGKRFYNPDNKISRAEFSVFVSKALGMKTPVGTRGVFVDVRDTHWAAQHIDWLAGQGLIDGTRDASGRVHFMPDDYVTARDVRDVFEKIDAGKSERLLPGGNEVVNRGEMAKIFYEFFDYSGKA